jgi:hypothetical protein
VDRLKYMVNKLDTKYQVESFGGRIDCFILYHVVVIGMSNQKEEQFLTCKLIKNEFTCKLGRV